MVISGGQRREIETVGKHRKGAGRTGGEPAQIEGQAIAQQFQPMQLAGPQRFGMGCSIGKRIMADADHLLFSGKGPDRKPIGPPAPGKQQMQLCVMGALRL